MFIKHNHTIKFTPHKWVPVGFLVFLMASCATDSSILDETVSSKEELSVAAAIAPSRNTRGYIDSGTVTEGSYNLSFPVSDNNYQLLTVNFGVDGVDPKIGFVDTGNPDKKFQWNMIYGRTPVFYLDNVTPPTPSSNPFVVTFTDSYNPFKAGLFDMDEGSNDLLWGDKEVNSQSTNTINFDLHHNMARLRVQVTADKTNEITPGDLDLTNAKVSISSLNQTPISFNRLDGTLTLPPPEETSAYTTLFLVDDNIEWYSAEDDQTNPNITVYKTQDFVLPPQNLLDDEDRPRLTIEIGDRVYSGVIPHAMLIADSSHPDELSYPVTLSFLKEYILVIRTVVTEDPPQLSFMPVYVVEWVDKGNYEIEAHQSGIYTEGEFYSLIKYYQSNNEYQLERYGKIVDDAWRFDIFRSLSLDYDKIAGTMKADNFQKPFSFRQNNYTILVTKDDMIQSISAEQLYNLVTGKSTYPF